MDGTGRIFEWADRKRLSNLRKHGLDFAECVVVFAGPVFTALDDRYDYGEMRYCTLGLLQDQVVSVVHTDEDGGLMRIISLRKADKDEQAYYFEALQN